MRGRGRKLIPLKIFEWGFGELIPLKIGWMLLLRILDMESLLFPSSLATAFYSRAFYLYTTIVVDIYNYIYNLILLQLRCLQMLLYTKTWLLSTQ